MARLWPSAAPHKTSLLRGARCSCRIDPLAGWVRGAKGAVRRCARTATALIASPFSLHSDEFYSLSRGNSRFFPTLFNKLVVFSFLFASSPFFSKGMSFSSSFYSFPEKMGLFSSLFFLSFFAALSPLSPPKSSSSFWLLCFFSSSVRFSVFLKERTVLLLLRRRGSVMGERPGGPRGVQRKSCGEKA